MNPLGMKFDFGQAPLMFYYEVTQGCDLSCQHCRASDPTAVQFGGAKPHPVVCVVGAGRFVSAAARGCVYRRRSVEASRSAGFDPLRPPTGAADCADAVGHAAGHARSTPAMQTGGRQLFGISLDGADAATHDAFRGWQGSFDRTMQMLSDARELDLPVQVNTTITRRNLHQIDEMANLFADKQIMMWSVFFLVPSGGSAENSGFRLASTRKYLRNCGTNHIDSPLDQDDRGATLSTVCDGARWRSTGRSGRIQPPPQPAAQHAAWRGRW